MYVHVFCISHTLTHALQNLASYILRCIVYLPRSRVCVCFAFTTIDRSFVVAAGFAFEFALNLFCFVVAYMLYWLSCFYKPIHSYFMTLSFTFSLSHHSFSFQTMFDLRKSEQWYFITYTDAHTHTHIILFLFLVFKLFVRPRSLVLSFPQLLLFKNSFLPYFIW